MEEVYSLFFADSGIPKEVVLELWMEVATILAAMCVVASEGDGIAPDLSLSAECSVGGMPAWSSPSPLDALPSGMHVPLPSPS